MREIECRKGLFRSELYTWLAPVQPPGNHQVQNQPEMALQTNGDTLADAAERLDVLSFHGLQWGVRRAEQKGAGDPDTFQALMRDALLQRFDINHNVGEFRHAAFILAWGGATVNPLPPRPAVSECCVVERRQGEHGRGRTAQHSETAAPAALALCD